MSGLANMTCMRIHRSLHIEKDNEDSELSTPILFMGNRLDPMTNLHTVRKVSNEGKCGSGARCEGTPCFGKCGPESLYAEVLEGILSGWESSRTWDNLWRGLKFI